jgi:hypothetical protein
MPRCQITRAVILLALSDFAKGAQRRISLGRVGSPPVRCESRERTLQALPLFRLGNSNVPIGERKPPHQRRRRGISWPSTEVLGNSAKKIPNAVGVTLFYWQETVTKQSQGLTRTAKSARLHSLRKTSVFLGGWSFSSDNKCLPRNGL